MEANLYDIKIEKLYRTLKNWSKLRLTKEWKTKDGETIRVFNLTDKHIDNILKHFEGISVGLDDHLDTENPFDLYDCYDAIGGDWEG